jgi:hypothetical protein
VNVPPHLPHLSSARPEMPHVSAVSVNQALYRPARLRRPITLPAVAERHWLPATQRMIRRAAKNPPLVKVQSASRG